MDLWKLVVFVFGACYVLPLVEFRHLAGSSNLGIEAWFRASAVLGPSRQAHVEEERFSSLERSLGPVLGGNTK